LGSVTINNKGENMTDWKQEYAKKQARKKEVLKFLNTKEKEVFQDLYDEWQQFQNTLFETQDIWLGDVKRLTNIIYEISGKFTK
tara:strand:- start:377 stop:628 length:252 start_codon:yes stop_codon:yes gene_type:complete